MLICLRDLCRPVPGRIAPVYTSGMRSCRWFVFLLVPLTACGGAQRTFSETPAGQELVIGTPLEGNTVGFANLRQPSCAPPGGADTTFVFEAPEAGWYRFSVEAQYDSVLTVYRNGIEAGCNDDTDSKRHSELSVELVAGERIELVIDGYGHAAGKYRIEGSASRRPVPSHVTGELALDTPVRGANSGEPDNFTPSCGSAAGTGDQVWQFEPEQEGTYRFRVSSEYDSVLALYDEAGQQLACNDDHRGTSASQLDFALTPGNLYQVVVDGYQTNHGSYSLVASQLGGDPTHPGTPGGGILSIGQSVSHATTGSTDRYTPNCGATAGSPDHVWELTTTEAGTLEIVLEAQFDGLLAVYDAQGTEVVCNDDDGPNRSLVVIGVAPGQVYQVVVDGYQGGQGAYQLTAAYPGGTSTNTPPQPPSPDGMLIARRPLSDDTTGSPDRLTPGCGSRPGTPDDIWEFRARRAGNYIFHVDSQYDSVLAVYDDNWSELGCNDDHQSTSASEVVTRLQRGQTVYVVVDGFGDNHGAYRLTGRRRGKRER